MTLSVCMIVKNEEKVLERCLECVKKIADEIIVVDTGSSDKTVKIAKKYTKNVFFYAWNNNFSDARNFSFSKATSDYVMWIDADDVITKENIKKILNLKNRLYADTYMLKYQIAFDETGRPTFEYYRERIVKNCRNAKFSGFIHEAISPFGNIIYENIAIEHRKADKVTNKKRNLNIFRYHIKNNVALNARETFYYARELYYNKYYKKTIKVLKHFLTMKDKFLPNIIDAHIIISDCYLVLDNIKKAQEILIKSLIHSAPNAIVCCKLAYTYTLKYDYKSAIFWYKTALISSKNAKSGEFVENDYYDFIPFLQLSFCFYKLGDVENFLKYHNLSKQIKPHDPAVLHNERFIKQNHLQ